MSYIKKQCRNVMSMLADEVLHLLIDLLEVGPLVRIDKPVDDVAEERQRLVRLFPTKNLMI